MQQEQQRLMDAERRDVEERERERERERRAPVYFGDVGAHGVQGRGLGGGYEERR